MKGTTQVENVCAPNFTALLPFLSFKSQVLPLDGAERCGEVITQIAVYFL